MENTNLNIPRLSIGEIINELFGCYFGAISKGIGFKFVPSVFLWGPPGVGKSQGVFQLARMLEKESGKKVNVTDVRLLLFNPVDLRGMPTVNEDKTLAVWLRPQIFQMDDSKDVINILFLDELSAAPQSLQAAAYQICLDRRVGEHELPENCIVIAAGNRTTDNSVSYKMPKALANRLVHFDVKTDFDIWRKWAEEKSIDSRIIEYLAFDNSKLCLQPEASDLAFPTPRAWEHVNRYLELFDGDLAAAHNFISACVGIDIAREFETFCKMRGKLPSISSILSGKCVTYPQTNDVLYALITSLTSYLKSRADKVLRSELENVSRYAKRFPPDFAMSFFKELNEFEPLKLKLMRCESFNEWKNKNKEFLKG